MQEAVRSSSRSIGNPSHFEVRGKISRHDARRLARRRDPSLAGLHAGYSGTSAAATAHGRGAGECTVLASKKLSMSPWICDVST